MTGETTSLPARESMRGEWTNFLSFVRRPILPDLPDRSISTGMVAVLRMLTLDIAAMSALLAIAAIVLVIGFELPQTALAGLEINWQLAVMVVVLAPLLEETAFRGWLSGKPGHVLSLIVLLALVPVLSHVLVVFGFRYGDDALASGLTAMGLSVIVAAIMALTILFLLRKRNAMGWFKSAFPLFFWLSTLAFASVHLLNFDEGNLMALLPLVLPQFILGSMLGYLRVHHGLWSSILLHALHNGLIIGVVALASAGGG